MADETGNRVFNPEYRAIIDEGLEFGKTAARIRLAQTSIDILIKLLIDKGIFTAEEFTERMRKSEAKTYEIFDRVISQFPETEPKDLMDIERHRETYAIELNELLKYVNKKDDSDE